MGQREILTTPSSLKSKLAPLTKSLMAAGRREKKRRGKGKEWVSLDLMRVLSLRES